MFGVVAFEQSAKFTLPRLLLYEASIFAVKFERTLHPI